MFDSIFNTCRGAPILSRTTTDWDFFLGFLELHLREPWQA